MESLTGRSFLHSTTFRTASKAARYPFQLPKQNLLASRIFRSPVELSCVVETFTISHCYCFCIVDFYAFCFSTWSRLASRRYLNVMLFIIITISQFNYV
ncbi:hypothetical protein IFM89_013241 [Coptis chinensis]|uniref:Uncharacterized protein n=1 Tax=Coptis chinensis TaxID=261450 RepID=A0A835ME97_9MAGN|nr:hypothetical protein IFM89_013241 [Coptis chinensis]